MSEIIFASPSVLSGEFTIPDGVTTIGNSAFRECNELTAINISDSVITIDNSAFRGCHNLTSVNIPVNIKNIGIYVFYDTDLKEINVSADNNYYCSVDNILYTKDMSEIVFVCPSALSGEFTIPDGVTTIGDGAFELTSLISVDIPDSVTTMGAFAFDWCQSLTSVNISNNITTIGENSFTSCSSLISVDIPASVTSIGGNAFYACSSLTDVIIRNPECNFYDSNNGLDIFPETTTIHGYNDSTAQAYAEQHNLKFVSLGDTPVTTTTSTTTATTNTTVSTTSAMTYTTTTTTTESSISVTIDDFKFEVYSDHAVLTRYSGEEADVVIPDTVSEVPVTIIGYQAFDYRQSLKSVVIPDSVKTIGDSAFYECSSLKSVKIADSVITLGGNIFENCPLLESANIPRGVTTIEEYTFFACSLKSIDVPENVTTIEEGSFGTCALLTDLIIRNPECNLVNDIFLNKYYTTNDEFWENITIHGYNNSTEQEYAEQNNIKFVSLGDAPVTTTTSTTTSTTTTSTTTSETTTTETTTSATTTTTDTSTSITTSATTKPIIANPEKDFEFKIDSDHAVLIKYSGNATEIVIPDTVAGLPVTTIGDDAFYDCDSLTSVNIPDNVTSIGNKAFDLCHSLTSIYIPDSVTSIQGNSFNICDNMQEINVSPDNSYYCSVDGVLYTKDMSEIVAYPSGLSEEFTIPDSVKKIGNEAFAYCPLTSVVIPDSVTTIGERAFADCTSLISVNIPDSVTTIESYAFDFCKSLKSIDIPDSITNIKPATFNSCTSLTSVNIPDSVTNIDDFAFRACSHKHLTKNKNDI
ncbi:MAG: leucine-rich repeat domain-containing protein [Ruminococcus sp.]|nr:leucine-rich repeat domain-containing protein [Ruminococcus sp.]